MIDRNSIRPDLSRPSSGYIPDEYYGYERYINDIAGRGDNADRGLLEKNPQ